MDNKHYKIIDNIDTTFVSNISENQFHQLIIEYDNRIDILTKDKITLSIKRSFADHTSIIHVFPTKHAVLLRGNNMYIQIDKNDYKEIIIDCIMWVWKERKYYYEESIGVCNTYLISHTILHSLKDSHRTPVNYSMYCLKPQAVRCLKPQAIRLINHSAPITDSYTILQMIDHAVILKENEQFIILSTDKIISIDENTKSLFITYEDNNQYIFNKTNINVEKGIHLPETAGNTV
jgi:hypothetical protein